MTARLLSGPSTAAGAESLADHRARLGDLPGRTDRSHIIPMLDAAGLLGRGGAGFPVGRKWASVAGRAKGDAVVLANGAEGEPLAHKDRVLMASRPHLVLDGMELAAEAVGARRAVLYVGSEHVEARAALERALAERAADRSRVMPRVPTMLVTPPVSYIAGEESAAVHFVNAGDPRPTTVPPRPYEKGVAGRPTLVQNVESLAHAALIARYGDAWYREAGRAETCGTALVTVTGGSRPGVLEIDLGTTIGELAEWAGVAASVGSPVLLGGYFGTVVAGPNAWKMALDPELLRRDGAGFGAGVVAFLGDDACGVTTTARIMDYMAGSSAAQCGPCVFGLRSIADASARIATGQPRQDDLSRLRGWSQSITGRGACRLPDGTTALLASSLRVYEADWTSHQHHRRCSVRRGAKVTA
ncbi:MAG TPA: NADH-ubiquinone oxidoreductase-F iron-sulfur binding region domain-containing protein [Candidatus Limnocylindrales bacterium]